MEPRDNTLPASQSLSRRDFVVRAVAGAAIVGSGLISDLPAAAPAPRPPLKPEQCAPLLHWISEGEALVTWIAGGAAEGWVEFGPTPALGSKAPAKEPDAPFTGGFSAAAIAAPPDAPKPDAPPVPALTALKARLTDLTPGQTVHYRVHTQSPGQPPLIGAARSFTVPNPKSAQAAIVIWNDTHDHPDTIRALQKLTAQEPADLLMWNGDFSNNIEREEQIIPIYLAPAEGLDVTAAFPMVYSRGNHDVRGARAVSLARYTGQPRSYYSFRLGPIAAIVLDTGEDKPDNHPTFKGRVAFEPFLKEQTQWLAEEIKKPGIADAPYRILFCHIPLRWKTEIVPDYAKTGYDHVSLRGRALWHDLLVQWKTQLVISGHTHESRYFPADDKYPYAQLVGGGPLAANARLMRINADAKTLRVRVSDLTGKAVTQEEFKPFV